MTRGRKSGLRDRLFSQMHPGLPPKVQRVPFGGPSGYKDEFDLLESQVHMVVTVLAAEAIGLGPVTEQQMAEVCDYTVHGLYGLEKLGWVECVGRVPRSSSKLWIGTKKAWRVLGLAGWKAEGAA